MPSAKATRGLVSMWQMMERLHGKNGHQRQRKYLSGVNSVSEDKFFYHLNINSLIMEVFHINAQYCSYCT